MRKSLYFGLANLNVLVVKGALVASVAADQTSALALSDVIVHWHYEKGYSALALSERSHKLA